MLQHRSDVEAGRRFQLSGPKKILNDIKLRESSMIEVTGLVRTSQLSPGGIAIAGGRIRIGGAVPQSPVSDPRRDPLYNQVVIDVESWRQLPESCPAPNKSTRLIRTEPLPGIKRLAAVPAGLVSVIYRMVAA